MFEIMEFITHHPIVTRTPGETRDLGRRLASLMRGGDLVLLRGTLGTGKTVLAQGIAEGIGVRTWRGSPSYNLINEYETDPALIHIDLYRLAELQIRCLGLEEQVREDSVVIVEWADRAPSYLRELARRIPIEIEIDLHESGARQLTIVGNNLGDLTPTGLAE
jgi:tRNA threonylcarbamoyladenosine biosynthesis protein TsaE